MFLVSSLLFFVWFPCGRLSWLLVSFWAHVNIVHHIMSQDVSGSRTKLELPIDFPVTEGLDLSAFVDANNNHRCQNACSVEDALPASVERKLNSCGESHLYDLYAVCSHSGSLQSGHYKGMPAFSRPT